MWVAYNQGGPLDLSKLCLTKDRNLQWHLSNGANVPDQRPGAGNDNSCINCSHRGALNLHEMVFNQHYGVRGFHVNDDDSGNVKVGLVGPDLDQLFVQHITDTFAEWNDTPTNFEDFGTDPIIRFNSFHDTVNWPGDCCVRKSCSQEL